MKIAFDISQTGAGKAGCGFFADAMLRGMLQIAPEHSYQLLRNFGDFFFDAKLQNTKLYRGRNVSYSPGIVNRERLTEYWTASDLGTKLAGMDILHANNYWCPRQQLSARLVYTLYDLSFVEEPSWTTEANRVGCFSGVFNAAIAADFIIAISNYTKQHFLTVFSSFPASRIEVVYPSSKFMDLRDFGIRPGSCEKLEPQKFWLSVGTIEPRKNQARLLRAYAQSLAAGGPRYPLVLAGGVGWLIDNFETEIAKLGIRDQVVLTSYATDRELAWLYRNCYGNVYVSLFEGFGLPVLEGMQYSAATIASNATSIPEIASDAAILVDPRDEIAIARALLDLGRSPERRLSLSSLAKQRAAQFKWADSIRQTLAIYDRALKLPKRSSSEPLSKISSHADR